MAHGGGSFSGFSGGNLGFGVAFMLEDQFSNTASMIQQRMASLGTATEVMATQINMAMDRIRLGAISFGVGVAMLLPFKRGLEEAADFESFNVRLTGALRSASAAKKVFDQLKADEPFMPFDLKTLVQANAMLITAGESGKAAHDSVMSVANAVAFTGGKTYELQHAMLAMQHVYEQGILNARTLMMFTMGSRLPVLQILAEYLYGDRNKAHEVREMISQGTITYDVLSKAFARAMATGGMMENGLYIMSQTIWGKITTLKTRIQLLFAAIGEAVIPVFHRIIDTVIVLLDKMALFAATPMGQSILQLIFFMGIFFVVMGAVLLLTNGLRFALIMSAKAFGDVTKAKIIDTVATRGLTAATLELGAAALKALWPYALAIGVITLALSAMSKETKEVMTSLFSGFNMSNGGNLLTFIKQVWDTWDGDHFTLNSDTWKDLNYNLDGTHTRLAKIIVKLHEFFEGVGTGFIYTLKFAIEIVSNIFYVAYLLIEGFVVGIVRLLRAMGFNIDNNISTLNRWKAMGIVVGTILSFWFMKVAWSAFAAGAAIVWSAVVAMAQFIAGAFRLIFWIGQVILSLFTQTEASIAAGVAAEGAGAAMATASLGADAFSVAINSVAAGMINIMTTAVRLISLFSALLIIILALSHAYKNIFGNEVKVDTEKYNNFIKSYPADQQEAVKHRTSWSIDQLDSMKQAGVKMGPLGLPIMSAEDQEQYDKTNKDYKNPKNMAMPADGFTPVRSRSNGADSSVNNQAPPAQGKSTTIVVPVNIDGQEVARIVREHNDFDNARNS